MAELESFLTLQEATNKYKIPIDCFLRNVKTAFAVFFIASNVSDLDKQDAVQPGTNARLPA